MARDLRDVMMENLSAREQSIGRLEPTPDAVIRTVRAVRRRRTVRYSSQALGAVALVALLAAASWFGLRADEPVPAVTPTPVVSTPQPTPSETPTAPPDEVVGLPPTRPLPPGMLEQTTSGWVLAIYYSVSSSEYEEVDGVVDAAAHTVVLSSPDGDLYRVVDLPRDTRVSLLHWEAGSTTAVVGIDGPFGSDPGAEPRAVLDLASGVLTPTDLGLEGGGPYASQYVGQAADGAELWAVATSTDAYTSNVFRVTDGEAPELVGGMGYERMLDPTRRWLVSNVPGTFVDEAEPFALLDVVSGGRTELPYGVPGQTCNVVGWMNPGQLLAFCLDSGFSQAGTLDAVSAHAAYYRIDVDATTSSATLLARLGPSEPRPWVDDGAWAAPGIVAFSATTADFDDRTACPSVHVWNGSATVPIDAAPGTRAFPLTSGQVLLEGSTAGCGGNAAPRTLEAYDVETGASTVLVPPPSPTPEVPVWAFGLNSWVLGD